MTRLEKLRTRGHWDIAVHPSIFKKARVEAPLMLEPIIRRSHVLLRGWDFPHVHPSPLDYGQDWVGQGIEWEHHIEQWRLYQSGLFSYVSGFWLDWNDQSSGFRQISLPEEPILSVRDVIYRFTELFEFAFRLSGTEVGGEVTVIEGSLKKLSGRELWFDPGQGAHFMYPRRTQMEEWPFRRDVTAAELANRGREIALEEAQKLFARFNWDASISVLRSHQETMGAG